MEEFNIIKKGDIYESNKYKRTIRNTNKRWY